MPADNKKRFYAEEVARLMESWRNVGTSAARCGSPGPQPPVEWTIKAELLPSTSALRKSSTSLFFSSSVALNQGLFSPHRHSVEKRRRAQMKPESQKLLSHWAHNKTDVILCDSDTHVGGKKYLRSDLLWIPLFSKGNCHVLLMHLEQLSHLISVV